MDDSGHTHGVSVTTASNPRSSLRKSEGVNEDANAPPILTGEGCDGEAEGGEEEEEGDLDDSMRRMEECSSVSDDARGPRTRPRVFSLSELAIRKKSNPEIYRFGDFKSVVRTNSSDGLLSRTGYAEKTAAARDGTLTVPLQQSSEDISGGHLRSTSASSSSPSFITEMFSISPRSKGPREKDSPPLHTARASGISKYSSMMPTVFSRGTATMSNQGNSNSMNEQCSEMSSTSEAVTKGRSSSVRGDGHASRRSSSSGSSNTNTNLPTRSRSETVSNMMSRGFLGSAGRTKGTAVTNSAEVLSIDNNILNSAHHEHDNTSQRDAESSFPVFAAADPIRNYPKSKRPVSATRFLRALGKRSKLTSI